MFKFILVLISLSFLSLSFGQKDYANYVLEHLCADSLYGRGYCYNGELKAAQFIREELQRLNIPSYIGNSYFQDFPISINTFPDSIQLTLNDQKVRPGIDFMINPASGSGSGSYSTVQLSNRILSHPKKFMKKVGKGILDSVFLVVDMDKFKKEEQKEQYNITLETIKQFDGFLLGGIVEKSTAKLSWYPSVKYTGIPIIRLNSDSFPSKIEEVKVELKNKFHRAYYSQNVIGMIPGKIKVDSYIVITAHYDHLGIMGPDVVFKGANDNASGVAMMLSLAQYFAKDENRSDYSIIIIAFGAEEIGLTGSDYFVRNPIIPLDKIKVLLNFDLLGTGDEGLCIVNGINHPQDVAKIKALNDTNQNVPFIKIRNNARNSDHYHFARKGVKAFFLYTMGGIQAYHDIYDIPKTLPLTKFNNVHQLMIDYIKSQNVN